MLHLVFNINARCCLSTVVPRCTRHWGKQAGILVLSATHREPYAARSARNKALGGLKTWRLCGELGEISPSIVGWKVAGCVWRVDGM